MEVHQSKLQHTCSYGQKEALWISGPGVPLFCLDLISSGAWPASQEVSTNICTYLHTVGCSSHFLMLLLWYGVGVLDRIVALNIVIMSW